MCHDYAKAWRSSERHSFVENAPTAAFSRPTSLPPSRTTSPGRRQSSETAPDRASPPSAGRRWRTNSLPTPAHPAQLLLMARKRGRGEQQPKSPPGVGNLLDEVVDHLRHAADERFLAQPDRRSSNTHVPTLSSQYGAIAMIWLAIILYSTILEMNSRESLTAEDAEERRGKTDQCTASAVLSVLCGEFLLRPALIVKRGRPTGARLFGAKRLEAFHNQQRNQ